ncbi:adenylate/guanylate cyclase protein [Rhizobium sp. N113]|uniref:adenylate/guanylate cyclase domain-containing protein n=1 Tax=unclassified Rhizobium TaxID=2613769 RepID=UPI0007EB1693|nr:MULTISPECIES: adenylate/guanylate cyclase domain-containing protein [unclassified Rhizobium]ANL10286.1 adenylate/guanylate cyclase protein [Rhizobium sp. N1341]ANL22338.1 adenylate/guanylate cyclase protein [Rhizobium sp. N113]ANM41122.1 adenylate/guanylate cyclase protein [Rhizobium sp. N741]
MQTIEDWLRQLGLGQYAEAFAKNDVDLRALPHLAESDLHELGVSLGHRKIILAAINGLAQPRPAEPTASAASEAAADRRLLSVLFCDLVGSTALSAQLDPEDMHELIRRYQDSVASAVTRFGGYVAKYLGDGVLAYFGWPMAYEDHAERSIRAGLEAMAAVDTLKSLNAQQLKARIGIASGHVVVGNTDGSAKERASIAGDTPNLAARLQGAAAPGQIVVSDSTRRLAGQSFNIESLGEKDLKGFTTPITLFEVRGERQVDSRFEAAHPSGLSKFVGRASEIGLLLERWQLARAGEGQAVFLSGEAGIGKSRLVEALEEHLRETQHELIRLQCSPYHATSAFYPIVERLSRVASFAPTDDRNTRVEKFRSLVRRYGESSSEVGAIYAELLSLDLGDEFKLPDLSAHQRKELVVRTLVNRLLLAARIAPVLMVFEDAHWMDPSTGEVLRELVGRLHGTAALVVVTHRPEWTADWASGLAQATTLSIGRLTRPQMRELIESMVSDIPEQLAERIAERTDGVPLFVEELTRSVVESGKSSPLSVEIPDSLQGSLMTRLDRLAKTTKEIAQIAAVIGREFDRGLLSKVAGVDNRTLGKALNQLESSQIVVEGGVLHDALVFRHALIQDAAYQSLLNRRRRHFHEEIARVLVDQYDEVASTQPELIAQHYEKAQRIELALPFWMKAGERALARSANYEAVDHFQNALSIAEQMPKGPVRRMDLLAAILRLGDALFAAGRMTDSLAKYRLAAQLAREAADAKAFVRAAIGLDGSKFLSSNSLAESVPLLKEALTMVEPADERSRCQLLSRLARGYTYLSDSKSAVEYLGEGIELARRVGDKTALVELSTLPFLTPVPVKSVRERNHRLARVDEIRRLANEIDDDDVLSRALSIDAYVSTELGDRARADRAVDALDELGTKRQHLNVQFYAGIAKAMMAILDGRFTAAEELADEALMLGMRTLGAAAEGVYGMQMFAIRREQSRLSEVAPIMKLLIEENPEEITWLPGFALVAFDLGYREAAQRRLSELARTGFSLPLDGKRSASLSFLTEVAAGLGDADAAQTLYRLMLDYKEMTVTIGMATVCFGAASRYLGVLASALGEFDSAPDHFEHALEMNSAIGSRPWLAHTQADYADLLMKVGSPAAIKRAMSLFEHARSTAAELGMVRLQQRLKPTIH